MISRYLADAESVFEKFSSIIDDTLLQTLTFGDEKGAISGDIYFTDESLLVFLEVINTQKHVKVKYKYQYMNKDKVLIFRYDNAPHHQELSSFPHHKHVTTGVGVIASSEPNLLSVLSEIESLIIL